MTSADFLQAASQFHFIRPWWFLSVPVLLFLMWRLKQRELTSDWEEFVEPDLLNAMLLKTENTSWVTPRRTATTIFILMVLSVAGPTWQKQESPLTDDLAPLVIILSLSESMLTEDVSPNRLQLAKLKIADLLKHRHGSATAIVVYAGTAHTVLPLTEDVPLLSFYLQELVPQIMPQLGNRPDLGLKNALHILKQKRAPGSVVFVASDLGDLQSFNELKQDFSDAQKWPSVSLLWVAPQESAGSASIETQYIDSQVDELNIHKVPITVNQDDIQNLLERIESEWQESWLESNDVIWKDFGYYLLWPMMLLNLLFFRRGMVLQW
jgi:Ca-activated chloride channel family protein